MTRKMKRHPVSGAPGIAQKKSAGAPALNPTTRKHGYLDPHAYLKDHEHPSKKFVGLEFQPCKPREKF